MDAKDLKKLVREIVEQSNRLKNKHTKELSAKVSYVAIFCHSEMEYATMFSLAKSMGRVAQETPTGPVLIIDPIDTACGALRILKIRIPDITRPQRGDADFTVADYKKFKDSVLRLEGFKLIERPEEEMIELMDRNFNVRVYFSNPPVDVQLGIN